MLAVADSNPGNIMAASFDPAYVETLGDELRGRLLQCVRSGVENPDSNMGCYACQPDDYDTLQPFFATALAKYHGVAEDAKHVNNWSLEGVDGLPEDGVLDLAALGLPELSMRVRVGRNLAQFPRKSLRRSGLPRTEPARMSCSLTGRTRGGSAGGDDARRSLRAGVQDDGGVRRADRHARVRWQVRVHHA